MRSLQSFPQADLGDAPHLGDFPGMESGGGRGGGESTEGSLRCSTRVRVMVGGVSLCAFPLCMHPEMGQSRKNLEFY